MERILVDDEWYYPISKDLLFEADFESQLIAKAALLFPGFTPVRFNRTLLSSEFGNSSPDFLLFDHALRCWWIVEVEMSRHSLQSHVEPQVASLAHANFSDLDIAFIQMSFNEPSKERIAELITNVQPNVLVIVEEVCEEWSAALKPYEATVITVKPFQSRQGQFVFQQIGSIPGIGTKLLSPVQIKLGLTRALVVDNRSAVPCKQGETIEIFVDGSPTNWRCHFLGSTLMLFCLEGRFPFSTAAGNYSLFQGDNGEMEIKKQSQRIIR